jgi:asparagine synthase (glutamine-hydrolysing)
MQGIAGTFGVGDKPLVRRMLAKLQHRGPDIQNVFYADSCTLGARSPAGQLRERASAIAEEDSIAVASDSYIFNREFLRSTIAPTCSRNISDAQLMLKMYKSIGTGFFRYVDGAYTVVIVDNGKTIIARDCYGLKPLYLSGDLKEGTYSSEIKSQQVTGMEFASFPPGRIMVSGEGFRRITPVDLPWASGPSLKNPPEQVRRLLIESVMSCHDDSGDLNVLLSGGIDSSVVAAAAAEVSTSIRSVCVGTENSEDIRMARLVADHLGTSHKERIYDLEDMLEILSDAIYYGETFDYPLVRSCIPNYMATHLFSNRQGTTLCGEGGDEVFAGYDFLLNVKKDRLLREERIALLRDGHRTGFQRVDRMTASASLDGRMPMMSKPIVDFGLQLDRKALVGLKVEKSKLVLRKAFADYLPRQVVWRRKQRFSDGAGSINMLDEHAERSISDKEFEIERRMLPKGRIRTKEELMYYRIFQRHFHSRSALAAIGFTPRP